MESDVFVGVFDGSKRGLWSFCQRRTEGRLRSTCVRSSVIWHDKELLIIMDFLKGEVWFTPSNNCKSIIFNLQLQKSDNIGHPTVETEQIWPNKFDHWGGFEGGLHFSKENKNILLDLKKQT